MPASAQFRESENVDHLDANFGAIALESAPGEWVEICRVHAAAIRRVTIEWRRGSGPYVLIPGATLELPEALAVAKPKKGANGATKDETEEVLTDLRHGDPAKWALDLANGRWRIGIEYAKKNGPVIDVRLAAWHFDTKKSQLCVIKGGLSAKRINLSGEQAAWMDGGTAPGSMESMNIKLLAALDRKDLRMNEQHAEVTKNLQAIGGLIRENVSLAHMLMQDRGGDSMVIAMDRQADRAWMLDMYKLQMTGEGITKAIDEIVPIAKTFAENWKPATVELDPVSKIAAELLETFSDAQKAKFVASSLGDLYGDLMSALKAIADCENKTDQAQEILKKVLPALEKHQNTIGPFMTGQQRAGFVSLVKASGLEDNAE